LAEGGKEGGKNEGYGTEEDDKLRLTGNHLGIWLRLKKIAG